MKKRDVYIIENDKAFKRYCKKNGIPLPAPPDKPINMFSLIDSKRPFRTEPLSSDPVEIFKINEELDAAALDKLRQSSDIYENFVWYHLEGDGANYRPKNFSEMELNPFKLYCDFVEGYPFLSDLFTVIVSVAAAIIISLFPPNIILVIVGIMIFLWIVLGIVLSRRYDNR